MPGILNSLNTYFDTAHICYSFLNFLQVHCPLSFWFWQNVLKNSDGLELPFGNTCLWFHFPTVAALLWCQLSPRPGQGALWGEGEVGMGRRGQSEPGWTFPKKSCISWYWGFYVLLTSSTDGLEDTHSPAIGTFQGFLWRLRMPFQNRK